MTLSSTSMVAEGGRYLRVCIADQVQSGTIAQSTQKSERSCALDISQWQFYTARGT